MIGKRLAHYEILSAIGKGGMGEVWRARDTNLGREVAIKTLPEEFAQDADRLARFEREAKLLASLNHPNIAAIHGFEQDGGTHFLIMELVEGDTLADRLAAGAPPVEASLKLALQIADALKAAHEKGVIHRDLKPANIKVTDDDTVKVLDFGLAKAFAGEEAEVNHSNSPTLSMQATQQGMILGTAAYMSPEQAKGRSVDKRTDVFAFGCVLFEMLTGRQSFGASDVTESLAAVIRSEPQWEALPGNLHPRLRETVERCLEKQVSERYQDIGDVRADIKKVLADPGRGTASLPSISETAPRAFAPWVAGLVACLLLGGIVAWILKPVPVTSGQVARFEYDLPAGTEFRNFGWKVISISPTGEQFVFNTTNGLYVRSISEFDERLLPGTDAPTIGTVWSPDGTEVAYVDDTGTAQGARLRKLSVTDGTVIDLSPSSFGNLGMSWERNGTIVYAQDTEIFQISENGGTPVRLVESVSGQVLASPQLLPGDEWLLYSRVTPRGGVLPWDEADIVVESLAIGESHVLMTGGSDARYLPTGHLVYALGGSLFAAPFDLDTMEVTSNGIPVVPDVQRAANTGRMHLGISDGGTLVYVPGFDASASEFTLAWVDRDGETEPLPLPPAQYSDPRLSPDGTQLVVQVGPNETGTLWIYDLSGDTQIRPLTQGVGHWRPMWTSDGTRITHASVQDGVVGIYSRAADGTGIPQPLIEGEEGVAVWPLAWSPDGQTLAFAQAPDSDVSTWLLSPERDSEPELFYDIPDGSGSDEHGAEFSPNGNWIAVHSDQGGEAQGQIFVLPFPTTEELPRLLTPNGGVFPLWSRDGSEMLYRRPFINATNEAVLVGVDIISEAPFSLGPERELPMPEFLAGSKRNFDITLDGERFLMLLPAGREDASDEAPKIRIVLNWFEELLELVPVE